MRSPALVAAISIDWALVGLSALAIATATDRFGVRIANLPWKSGADSINARVELVVGSILAVTCLALLRSKALKLAGKKLTRAGLRHALDTRFRHYKTGFTGSLNWTPTQHYGARQFKIYQIRNNAFAPVTSWLSP